MAVHTSPGSFESGSITQEQRMEVLRGMSSIYASRVYVVSNNEQHVNGLQNP
jgi:hypothetical protein